MTKEGSILAAQPLQELQKELEKGGAAVDEEQCDGCELDSF
jgi:hypothetical protein